MERETRMRVDPRLRDEMSRPAGQVLRTPRRLERVNPPDFSISLRSYGPAAGGECHRRQPMRGFEATYTDIVDYIVRITERIWNDQDVGYLHRCYADDIEVITEDGVRRGRATIIEGVLQHLAAFPDTRVLADEIIWAGDEDAGFCTSHRNISVAHHTGLSGLGTPTGRKSVAWGIANCVSRENYIFEEHEQFDTITFQRQLGLDPHAIAREEAADLPLDDFERRFAATDEWLPRGSEPASMAPAPDEFDVADFVVRAAHHAWNWRDMSAVDCAYATAARWHGPSGRAFYGRRDVKGFMLSLLNLFPDLAYHVDDLYFMGNPAEGFRVATRWTMVGTHRGGGLYGPPTGRRVHLWGITQQVVEDAHIVEEWTLFNEFEVLKQIYRPEPVAGA